jgi:hypothetical protein
MNASAWNRQALVQAVQRHCHIADAAHAGDLPLCIYLLQMREFYRWEQGLPFGAALAREAVGTWLSARETLWNELEGQPLQPLPLPTGPAADALDEATVNARLQPLGLVYGAGLVAPERPSYFVAELLACGPQTVDGEAVTVQVCGRELARGLASPMAMLAPAGGHGAEPRIVLRQAALARWLWERFESAPRPAASRQALQAAPGQRPASSPGMNCPLDSSSPGSAPRGGQANSGAAQRLLESHSLHAGTGSFQAVAQRYGLSDADSFNAALPSMLSDMGRVLLLHEVGELRAGRQLGPAWPHMRQAQAGNRRAELRLRAVRDLLADLGTTLPALLNQHDDAGLQLWLASFEGHRETLFPGLKPAAQAWQAGDGGGALRTAVAQGHRHFSALAKRLLALHEQGSEAAAAAVAQGLDAPASQCTL